MSPRPEKLSEAQREGVTRRVLAGEAASSLAAEFGVTRAYVSLLKAQALDPERFAKKRREKLIRKLTDEQLAAFREAIKNSSPHDLGLDPPTLRWCLDHGYQLAYRMFGKRPSKRVMDECLAPVLRGKPDLLWRKPRPPEPHHIKQLDPELAKDPDFVAYYLSPICEQIAWREYERALADWQERFGDAEEVDLDDAENPRWEEMPSGFQPAPMTAAAPGLRTGKHARSKGSHFTPPKKKRRKRR